MENEILHMLKKIDSRFDVLETKVDENTKILRALEHSSQVNKVEHDKMSNDILHIQGGVEALRRDISQVELVTANNWADIVKLKAIK